MRADLAKAALANDAQDLKVVHGEALGCEAPLKRILDKDRARVFIVGRVVLCHSQNKTK